ncbi:MAG TPA: hypothetical protein VM734_26320 [Kofleriaceae bacterium]|nr:hypothetical protein [Kofleriaceae bacterium]
MLTPGQPDRELDEIDRLLTELAGARAALRTQRARLDALRRTVGPILAEAEQRGELALAIAELDELASDRRGQDVLDDHLRRAARLARRLMSGVNA